MVDNAPYGNLSNATALKPNNQLVIMPCYELSYNSECGYPNWVQWSVEKEDIGNAPRVNDFHTDSTLPDGIYRVKPSDYDNSGYDRGHNCDCRDRTATPEEEHYTFDMINMTPQAKRMNEQTWKGLEEWTRKQVEAGYLAEVVCGVCGGEIGRIAGGRIGVPAKMWKVVALCQEGKLVQVVCVIMPNSEEIEEDWRHYQVDLEEVESATGYTFPDWAK
jgi:endonuclease G